MIPQVLRFLSTRSEAEVLAALSSKLEDKSLSTEEVLANKLTEILYFATRA